MPAAEPTTMHQRIEFKTQDGVALVGDYYAPAGSWPRGLLLLHMMPADRASWRAFAEKMQAGGWPVLAVDLRGHGESQGGPEGYRKFSDAEHQASRFDVEAGAEFLKSKGVLELALGGASIGANLAFGYLAEHPEARSVFLLSPGLDYRGVRTEDAARSLRSGQAVYFAASRDDVYSAESAERLHGITPAGAAKAIRLFDAAGHGTAMFEREPSFMDEVAAWLQKSLQTNN